MDKCEYTALPPKEKFYNRLNECDITEEDYQHAIQVWKTFNIKNLGEYSDLYIKTDVLLLCDVFQNFRKVCLQTYQLDPTWYYTAPGLSWDAMLKSTGQDIELITDYEMLLFVEAGIRGGISQCANRMGIANNKYMGDAFNPNEASKFLLYLDANNLYGWAMSQALPTGHFEWGSTDVDVNNISDDSPIGCILEVDLGYPKHLHDEHSDLPFAPQNQTPPGCKEQRLMTTLHDKQRYVLHYRTLKQCLKHGLTLEKIHRVLTFQQSPWLQSYIDTNTRLRTQASDGFSKDFYKLMNNSIFGKTMENIRRRVDIRLCTTAKQVEKLLAKPNFYRRAIFSEHLVGVQMRRTKLTFNKPIALGMSILDISKVLMYDFHYSHMKSLYENLRLLYMDTDSLIYEIHCDDVYRDMKNNVHLYDTSEYAINNPYDMPRVNKKKIGMMKDENQGKIMTHFVGLKSKMYAYKVEDEEAIKKLKGIKKSCLRRKIQFDDYVRCLENGKNLYTSMNLIRSRHHDLHSVTINKLALSRNDMKRYILPDGIHTLAWGHKDIPDL